jgi:hypothetical protein
MISFDLSKEKIDQQLRGFDFIAVKDFLALSFDVAREEPSKHTIK